MPEPRLRVAIVGGGFSGTAVLAHLAETLPAGSAIALYEKRGRFGPGTAYATEDPSHLLNVQAGRMGAFAPEDFYRWLSTPEGQAALCKFWPKAVPRQSDYLPRAVFGVYLSDLLIAASRKAEARGLALQLIAGEVRDAEDEGPGFVLRGKSRGRAFAAHADVLVLASGNRPALLPLLAPFERAPHLAADPWNGSGKALPRKGTVLLLGTGLTAIDTILSLEDAGFAGRIVAVSRHGLLPASHAPVAAYTFAANPFGVPARALALLAWLRGEARRAEAGGNDWRAVVDALRPYTPALFRRLAPGEQKTLLRYHSLWSIHRHRMAPQVAARIEALRNAGRLEIARGRLESVRRRLGGFHTVLAHRGRRRTLRPGRIFNCTGPAYNLTHTDDPLLAALVARGLLQPHANGAGMAVMPGTQAQSAANPRLFAMGTLLVGSALECTAVPELRGLAKTVAADIAALAG